MTTPARRGSTDPLGASRLPPLRVQLLGKLELRLDGRRLAPPASRRARSLLAHLVLHPDVQHSRSRLASLLWPDSPASQARTNLRNVLHLLLRGTPELAPFLEATAATLRWRGEGRCTVDIDDFLSAADRLDAIGPGSDHRLAAAREAMAHYRGGLLDDCDDEWLAEQRERLRERRVAIEKVLVECLLDEGHHGEALHAGRDLVRSDPLDEECHLLLLRAHEAAGDLAGAMRAYHDCAAILQRELGVQPSRAIRDAHAAVVRSDDAARDTEPVLGDTPVIVGRDPEWAALTSCWREALAGRPQLVLLTGEPGIGKTRLAEELVGWCSRRGAVVGQGRSYPNEGELGYGVIVSWLRSPDVMAYLQHAAPAEVSALARLLPELGTPTGGAPGIGAVADRLRLFDAVVRSLTASARPVLLVADDVQWCDLPSLQLIHYLVRAASARALLVVATARREELDEEHPLLAMLRGLELLERGREIRLHRLTPEHTEELVLELGGEGCHDVDAHTLYDETEGNPLFVVEAMRSGWAVTHRLDGLTPRLQALITGRLQQLTDQSRHLLGVAATVGRGFTTDLVGRAAGLDDLTLVRALDELWRRGMIREHGPDAFDFSHGKIREAAYDSLSPALRRTHHLRVAEALVALHETDPDVVSAQLAAHYDRGGQHSTAIDWYQRAAVEAQRRYADVEAVRLLERARTLVAGLPGRTARTRELAILFRLPTVLVAVEGYASDLLAAVQQEAVEAADALGAELEPPLRRSLVLSSLCRDEFAEAGVAAERLTQSAERAGDEGLAVESRYLQGIAAFWGVDLDGARHHFTRVVHSFRSDQRGEHLLRFGQDPQSVCLSRLANTLWFLGDAQGAREARDEAVTLARRVGHPHSSDVTHVFAAMLCLDLEEADGFLDYAHSAAAGGARSRAIHIKSSGLLGYAEVLEGRAESGIERIRTAIDDCRGHNLAPGFRHALLRVLLAAHAKAGDSEGGLAAADVALRVPGTRLWEGETRRLRAEFLVRSGGSVSDAETELDRAVEVARRQGALGPARRMERTRAVVHAVGTAPRC